MDVNFAKLIEAWFVEHADDAEFICGMGANPYSVIVPTSSRGSMVFTTKPALVVAAIDDRKASDKIGMIGRYGLPSETDLPWVREVVGQRPFRFLGDMDPVDLLVFAWLRASLHPQEITHEGINDVLLRKLQISSPPSLSIPCASSEQESIAFLGKVFPDFSETVGRRCSLVLEGGNKIELESVVSATGRVTSILPPIL
jgi:hypothetical protein